MAGREVEIGDDGGREFGAVRLFLAVALFGAGVALRGALRGGGFGRGSGLVDGGLWGEYADGSPMGTGSRPR